MPKLRFKDGKNDYVDPEELILSDLFDKVKTTNKDGKNKNVITNSAEKGLIPQRDFFEKDIAVEGNTNKYVIINKGDFVYNPRKSTTAPYGPFKCYRLDEPGIVSPLYSCLKPKYPEYTPYLLYYFESPAWHEYIYRNGNQGGARHDRVGMTEALLKNIPIILPSEPERKKIVSTLENIDNLIAIEEKKVNSVEKRRKSILHQLFNHELEFKGFGEWEEHELGEYLEEYCERNKEEKYEAVSVGKLGIRKRSDVFTRELTDNYSNNKLIYAKTLIIAMGTKQIDIAIVPKTETEIYSVSPAYTTYKVSGIDELFLQYMLENYNGLLSNKYMIVSVRQGKSVDKGNMLAHIFEIPSEEEQSKIVSFMQLLDEQLRVESSILEKLKTIKKELLTELFV